MVLLAHIYRCHGLTRTYISESYVMTYVS
ncbi:hypothetical protein F383_32697 [Gossypium arboreum]|uniref:Uncharacterized protein n=1 Tax=Gossypium arboreum TaxID=29729 RepID=A0A0B0MZ93_GOSAR|nr:hypothetical protein F383_32697 [Gossypium arboreum]